MYMRTEPWKRKEHVAALQKNRALAIINDPRKTLGLQLSGYKAKDSIRLYESRLMYDPPSESKGILKVFKGKGGGKTRYLEELRLALLNAKDSKILPLAITFSSSMVLLPKEKYAIDSKSPKNNHAYAIVKRMAGVLYGLSPDDVGTKYINPREVIQLYDRDSMTAEDFIRGFIAHVAEKTRKPKIVVMLDEAHTAEEFFQKDEVSEDLAHFVRVAVLYERIKHCQNTILVISSSVLVTG